MRGGAVELIISLACCEFFNSTDIRRTPSKHFPENGLLTNEGVRKIESNISGLSAAPTPEHHQSIGEQHQREAADSGSVGSAWDHRDLSLLLFLTRGSDL